MNIKFFNLLIALFLFIGSTFAQKQPKYIFFMIGDGMGLNQVQAAEIYKASLDNKNTVYPTVFSQFPYATFATSHSQSHGVTDSGAGGTALAVGYKTKNGVIAMDSAGVKAYKSIAYLAKEKGMKVGITTSVSIDHATPASFYANQPDRDMYYEIGLDIIKSNFDFFAGSGFLKPTTNAKKEEVASIFPQLEKAGYKLLYGLDDYKKANKSDKLILMNNKGTNPVSLKFAIDQKPGDLNLSEITSAAIESLSQGDKGFFLMVEGGKIDWACHSNDGAAAIHEVLDFNNAVQKAYEFYQKHPEETLIIVTADHETGGMGVGNGSSTLRIKNLENQKISQEALSLLVNDFRTKNPNASWDQLKEFLGENLGLWKNIKVSEDFNEDLQEAYEKSFVEHKNETSKSLYATSDKIADLAIKALNKASSVSWASGSHSAAYIPVYAIGVGSEEFHKKMDNVDIPRTVSKVAGWPHP
ncbi:alkaline phosphatase [Sphingobacterium daejeonense]|uniref:alkaline phosphatase n=1 Tax=Sphingobacterium daejeonense TaxID=371142 RepID=UPI0021A3AF7A|nr:alkaline phosphatase [Sphingobacterium daejeonense]MCT1529745.1 alkaline phosphatase [Sphingobacterium daejeonense]